MSQIGSWTACVWSWFCYHRLNRNCQTSKTQERGTPCSQTRAANSPYFRALICTRVNTCQCPDFNPIRVCWFKRRAWEYDPLLTTWKYIMGTMGCLKYMHSYWAKVPAYRSYSLLSKMGWKEMIFRCICFLCRNDDFSTPPVWHWMYHWPRVPGWRTQLEQWRSIERWPQINNKIHYTY